MLFFLQQLYYYPTTICVTKVVEMSRQIRQLIFYT
jgi:hypothetical protein